MLRGWLAANRYHREARDFQKMVRYNNPPSRTNKCPLWTILSATAKNGEDIYVCVCVRVSVCFFLYSVDTVVIIPCPSIVESRKTSVPDSPFPFVISDAHLGADKSGNNLNKHKAYFIFSV